MAETSTSMEALPDLVLRYIAADLSGAELAAWCAVSRTWRDRLNQDEYWQPRCDPETAEYLRHTECRIQPGFVNPEDEVDTGLSKICEWRLAYMRQTHLWNNWRRNCSTSVFVPDEANSYFTHQYQEYSPQLIYKNDYLVVCDRNELQLWKIEASARKICGKTLPNRIIKMLKLYGDSVVVKQDTLVQMFEISIAKAEFVFERSFVSSEASSFALRSNLLVEVKSDKSTLQVWNIQTGEMVKEEKRKDTVSVSDCCVHKTYFVLKASRSHQDKTEYFILVYRLPDVVLVFTSKFYANYIIETLIEADHIFIKVSDYIDTFSLKTSQHIQQINIFSMTNLEKFGNKVCFADNYGNLIKLTPGSENIETIPNKRGLRTIVLDRLNSEYFLQNVHGDNYILSLAQIKGKEACHIIELGRFTELKNLKVNKARTKLYINYYDGEVLYTHDKREQFEVVSFW